MYVWYLSNLIKKSKLFIIKPLSDTKRLGDFLNSDNFIFATLFNI